jgi:hypothetical protein
LPVLGGYRVSQVSGAWGGESMLRRTELAIGEMLFTSRVGHTGYHANPWLMVDDGTAAEEHGEVWSGALAWSGSWRITLSRDPADRAGFTGGSGHDGLTWRLDPGAELETPVFAGVYAPDKWDFNRPFADAGWPGHDDPDRLWIDHVRGVYVPIDRLRADHPRLWVEACAGGGGRADLGMMARADQVWTSDNTDAADRIGIQHGYSQLYPARTMGAWVTDAPNPLTARWLQLRFRFHVAMTGALGLGGDLRTWSDQDLAEAAVPRPAVQNDPAGSARRRTAPARRTRSAVLGSRPSGGDRLATQRGDPVERASATGRPRPVGDSPRRGHRPGPPRSRAHGARVAREVLSPRLHERTGAPGQGRPRAIRRRLVRFPSLGRMTWLGTA